MSTRRPAPPSGMPPPTVARLPDGSAVELRPLAQRITDVHLRRHPEDVERYGAELAREWGVHDNQHLLEWAIGDIDLAGQVAWLARVLDARGYPVANLADNLMTGAGIVADEIPGAAGHQVAERMQAAARSLAEPPA
jgi:hypothetical protein